jgi:putative membrane protein
MKIITHWFISALAIIITAYILPGVHVSGFVAALIMALVLGIVNGVLKPILVILTLPITIVTLGLFLLVLNTLLIMLSAKIVPGIAIDGFLWSFIFGIVLSLISSFLDRILEDKKPQED